MKKFLNFTLSLFILTAIMLFIGSNDVSASSLSVHNSDGSYVVGTYNFGDVSYDEEYLKTFTLKNNSDKDITILIGSITNDFTKTRIKFPNNNTFIPAGESITVDITLLATKDNLVGPLNDSIYLPYWNSDYVQSSYTLTIESTIVPKVVAKPSIDPDSNIVYSGFVEGIPLKSGSVQSLFMSLSGDVNMLNAGSYTTTISFKDKYKDSFRWDTGGNDPIDLIWSIAKVTETLNGTTYNGITGNTLSTISLPTGWTWDNENTVIQSGSATYPASYTPTDTTNYNSVNAEAVEVSGVNQYLVTLPNDSNVVTNPSSDFKLFSGESKDVTLTTLTGYVFTSIKINGVEQITDTVSSYTVNISNISDNIVIETKTEIPAIRPIEGDNQILVSNDIKDVNFKFDLDFNTFRYNYIKLNGIDITGSNDYSFNPGSVILTLSKNILSTLGVGTHTIEIGLESGGVALATLTIEESVTISNPKTGDNIFIYFIASAILTVGIVGINVYRKK